MSAQQIQTLRFSVEKPERFAKRRVPGAAPALAEKMEQALRDAIDTPWPPASSPGRPPHLRTGFLHDHTVVRGSPVSKSGTASIVIRGPQYGMTFLEGGTRNMAPRPYIKPTIFDQPSKWTKEFARIIRKMVK